MFEIQGKYVAIRNAAFHDIEVINEIAFAAKASWNYSPKRMQQFRAELTYSGADLSSATTQTLVAVASTRESDNYSESQSGTVIGFFKLQKVSAREGELDALFIRPDFIGYGLGRWLWQQAVQLALDWKLENLLVQSDPNAEGFYLAMGARTIGVRPSESVQSRKLPLLRYDLTL